MKPSIFTNLNNGAKFHNYTYWLVHITRNHHLSCQVSNHHINNKDLVFMSHIKVCS